MLISKNGKKRRRNEGFVLNSKSEELDRCLMNDSKSVCKLRLEVNSEIKNGTGFLLRYPINGKYFNCLLSNERIIKEKFIKNKFTMNISYNYERKNIIIKLDENERYIRNFKDIGLDIILIEISKCDDINDDYFLFPELDYIKKDLKNKQIFIPQFHLGKKIENTLGIIRNINKYEFTLLVNKDQVSSGNPIFLCDTKKVIGIYKQNNNSVSENNVDFIYPIFDLIKEDIKKIKSFVNNNNESEKKIRDKQKNFHKKNVFNFAPIIIIAISIIIPYLKNIPPNGKRKIYYPNGNIKYEGDYMNDKFEGKGILYYENGNKHYEGNFVNNKFEGKGIIYYENGDIGYEGDFENDKSEGKGIFYYENGIKGYEGDFVNNKFEGKGILYYENGDINYEGDFVNNKFEGKGILYYESGYINYEGDFDNNVFEGKGILYYENGNKHYEGDFVNDIFEGKGILYYENGDIFYEGDYINGRYEGKGILYYENGNRHYVGDFVNNKFEGKGILYYENGNKHYEGDFVNNKFEDEKKEDLPNEEGKEYYDNRIIKN